MAMIFKQFMVNCCCEMFIKFKIISFLIFLIIFDVSSAENARNRRRPNLETKTQEDLDTNLPDQIAVATNYNSFQTYENSGAKLVNIDKENSDDGETPEQYVAKALKLRTQNLNENSDKSVVPLPDTSVGKYEVYEGFNSQSSAPLVQQAYSTQKDSVTRASYDLYDDDDNENISKDYFKSHGNYGFSTYRYEPQYLSSSSSSSSVSSDYDENQHHEDKVQSSPSNEIPKSEILKHIEESVVKYMKNLEAEGKLPLIRDSSKLYHKTPTTVDSGNVYNAVKTKDLPHSEYSRTKYVKPSTTARPIHKEQKYQLSTSDIQDFENVDPENIEFVYKPKQRSPSQTQLQKGSLFDHAAALKNLEGFDLSHVMLHSQDEKPSKPKLYFNSETYHDINSLPYKPEKTIQRPSEHRTRERSRGHSNSEINDLSSLRHANEPTVYSGKGTEDGYPGMNPYKYYFNSQFLSKYGETNLTPQPADWQGHISKKQALNSQSYNPGYDSYNPKYNNNPDGYGYQHNYKQSESVIVHPTKSPLRSTPKRGKRGGGHKKSGRGYVNSHHGNKDSEANVALRPPPYKE